MNNPNQSPNQDSNLNSVKSYLSDAETQAKLKQASSKGLRIAKGIGIGYLIFFIIIIVAATAIMIFIFNALIDTKDRATQVFDDFDTNDASSLIEEMTNQFQ